MVADLPPCSFSFVATGHSQGCRQALYSRPRSEAHRLNGVWQQLVDPGGRCRALCEKCEFFALRSLHPSDYRFCICWRPIANDILVRKNLSPTYTRKTIGRRVSSYCDWKQVLVTLSSARTKREGLLAIFLCLRQRLLLGKCPLERWCDLLHGLGNHWKH